MLAYLQYSLTHAARQIPKSLIAPHLPGHTLTSKEDVLPRASERFPFEVCAAVDMGIATAAPVYLGTLALQPCIIAPAL